MGLQNICVFCGASFNGDPELLRAINELATELVRRDSGLVYGGGNVGVMGLIANAVLDRGGRVTGVIPQFLLDREVGHFEVTKLYITENMHERKKQMSDISDAFIVLPGGFGTLEEFFEVLTWLQLGLHSKPIALLNVGGFYDALLEQLDTMVARKFLSEANRRLVICEEDPALLLDTLEKFSTVSTEQWFQDRNLT